MALGSDNLVDWMYLDQVDYSECLSLQRELQERVSLNNRSKGFLLLVQHNPVVTIGRFGKTNNILLPEDEMKKREIEIWRIERGGDVTFHGPGQLVGYPIINLEYFQLGVKSYVQLLEDRPAPGRGGARASEAGRGRPARRASGHEKVAAIGV